MHHLEGPDLHTGLLEAARALRPGGTIVASFKAGDAGQYLPAPGAAERGLYYAYQRPEALRSRFEGADLEIRELDINIPPQPRPEFAEGQTGWLTVQARRRPDALP